MSIVRYLLYLSDGFGKQFLVMPSTFKWLTHVWSKATQFEMVVQSSACSNTFWETGFIHLPTKVKNNGRLIARDFGKERSFGFKYAAGYNPLNWSSRYVIIEGYNNLLSLQLSIWNPNHVTNSFNLREDERHHFSSACWRRQIPVMNWKQTSKCPRRR